MCQLRQYITIHLTASKHDVIRNIQGTIVDQAYQLSRLSKTVNRSPRIYSNTLKFPGLWSLEQRRNRADLTEVFKIMKGFSSIPVDTFFQLSKDGRTTGFNRLSRLHERYRRQTTDDRQTTDGSTTTYSESQRSIDQTKDLRHHFFSERVVNRWNQLSWTRILLKHHR